MGSTDIPTIIKPSEKTTIKLHYVRNDDDKTKTIQQLLQIKTSRSFHTQVSTGHIITGLPIADALVTNIINVGDD